MDKMSEHIPSNQSALNCTWKIPVGAVIFAAGMVAGRLLVYLSGHSLPRMPQQADESTAVWYLLGGSLLLAAAVLPLARSLVARFAVRWLLLSLFSFVCFGLSTTLESAIYSDVEGYRRMIFVFVTPTLLLALFAAGVSGIRGSIGFGARAGRFFRSRPVSAWLRRGLLALIAFPAAYLIFGMIAAPFVTGYYEQPGFGLALPGIGTIIGMQFFRSLLFLLVTVPLLIVWTGRKRTLIASLAWAHFVFVYAYDIVLAFQMPPILLVVHGVEIALDSIVYAWVFVAALRPARGSVDLR